MAKRILMVLLLILICIQFVRPEKNLSDSNEHSISKKYVVPVSVSTILQKACNDCHSNKTNYPWYSEIQPFGLWLNHHVNEGKSELNFSNFTKMPIAIQNHKFDEIIETVESGEMPLSSYKWLGLHKDADLSELQKNEIIEWARHQMDSLKSVYPADSLKMPKRRPGHH
jgi:hypothetical protein